MPIYFPSTVCFLDDDHNFLQLLSIHLDRYLPYRLFNSVQQLQNFLLSQHESYFRRYRKYAPYNHVNHDTLENPVHRSVDALQYTLDMPDRFSLTTVVVVDYKMPEKSGTAILFEKAEEIEDLKTIMLTGVADSPIAVDAFNRDLIDRFYNKKELYNSRLNEYIFLLQKQLFYERCLFQFPSLLTEEGAFLKSQAFIEFFATKTEEFDIIEHVFLLDPPGLLMGNKHGKRFFLLVLSEESKRSYFELVEAADGYDVQQTEQWKQHNPCFPRLWHLMFHELENDADKEEVFNFCHKKWLFPIDFSFVNRDVQYDCSLLSEEDIPWFSRLRSKDNPSYLDYLNDTPVSV